MFSSLADDDTDSMAHDKNSSTLTTLCSGKSANTSFDALISLAGKLQGIYLLPRKKRFSIGNFCHVSKSV